MIIVNYNVKYFLEQCLCAVRKACGNIDAEIIVVDNNSADGSIELLTPVFSEVQFIRNDENPGFAKASNQALSMAGGDYILFLNPDTIIPEDCFEKCIAFFRRHAQAGALGVRMIDGSGKYLKESKRAFPSPLTSLFKLTGLASLFPHSKIFAKYYLGQLNENENNEVDVLAGAFMMIPAAVLKITGGFDERFFMYGEDVDLSYRIQKSGYINYYFAETSIIHFKGESTKRGSLNYVRLFYKAMSLFVKKHYSKGGAGLFIFFIQLAILIRAIIAAIGGLTQRLAIKIEYRKSENTDEAGGHQTIIVSGKKDFIFMAELIRNSKLPERITGWVNNNTTDIDGALGNIQQLSKILKESGAKEIIFCENGLSFKEIISTIQQLPSGIRTKFHASGSSSIVGSEYRDRKGDYIADKHQ